MSDLVPVLTAEVNFEFEANCVDQAAYAVSAVQVEKPTSMTIEVSNRKINPEVRGLIETFEKARIQIQPDSEVLDGLTFFIVRTGICYCKICHVAMSGMRTLYDHMSIEHNISQVSLCKNHFIFQSKSNLDFELCWKNYLYMPSVRSTSRFHQVGGLFCSRRSTLFSRQARGRRKIRNPVLQGTWKSGFR